MIRSLVGWLSWGTVLLWGSPGVDNPEFPGAVALAGLVIAVIGGVLAVTGGLRLLDAAGEREGYPSLDDSADARAIPAGLMATGVALLTAGVYVLQAVL